MARAFERVFVIMLENELESAVLQDDDLRGLQGRGVRLSDYYGVTHPSQPNYLAAVAGLPFVTSDDCQDIEATSLIDFLEAKGITWKVSMETFRRTTRPSASRPTASTFASTTRSSRSTTSATTRAAWRTSSRRGRNPNLPG